MERRDKFKIRQTAILFRKIKLKIFPSQLKLNSPKKIRNTHIEREEEKIKNLLIKI